MVSKYHDCQVIHSSCFIVGSMYIVTCRQWLFSLPLIVMFVNWQTAQYLTDDAVHTFQGLIINVSFNDLLLHNLFIPFVQNIKTSNENQCTIMRFSYTYKLVLIIHFIQMKWHALKFKSKILPQVLSCKQIL